MRIDTVEQAIRDLCNFKVEGEGYRLSYRIASDNLNIGNNVIADSCNPVEFTRSEWNEVANNASAEYINIEIICSDKHEHRWRVEARVTEVIGLDMPTWQEVENREYHPWRSNRIIIDTAKKSVEESVHELLRSIHEHKNDSQTNARRVR